MTKTMDVHVMLLFIAVIAASAMLRTTEGAKYMVGGDLGWTVPPGGAAAYAKWTSKHKFVVGDIIIFDFDVGKQNLAFVTKENFHKCNTRAPLFVRNDPIQIKFDISSTYYITSTFHGHCKKGQKVAIHIRPSSSSTIASISRSPSSATEAPEALVGLEILSL